MSTWFHDLRVAIRRMGKTPGSTATAVTILALGLGSITALFSVVHGVLLTPLPYPEADRIYRLLEYDGSTGNEENAISAPTFRDWRAGLSSFQALTATHFTTSNLTGARDPQQLRVARVDQEFLTVFDPSPRPGRVFTAIENGGSPAPVVILGHAVWQRQFGGRDDVVGSVVELDGASHTVVGVMPAEFQFPAWADVWLPLGDRSESLREQRDLFVYGRLAVGSDRRTAAAELDTMAGRLAAVHPETHENVGAKLRPLLEEEVGEVRETLLMLFGAVASVLVIVCLNVAGLQLARGLERRRELALRTALGAGRRQVMRQLLTESLVLAGIGGAAGVMLAHWGFGLILAVAPSGIPRLAEASIDGPVLAFAFAVTLLTGMAAGWLPALSSTRFRLGEALKARGQAGAAGGGFDRRSALVVAQVALTVMLLAAAGLLVGSLQNLLATRPGFDVDRVLSVGLVLPPDVYPESHQRVTFADEVCRRLDALPEVDRSAAANSLPWSGFPGRPLKVETQRSSRDAPAFQDEVIEKVVSGGFFETLGVPLLAGRTFGPEDRSGDVEAVVVNEAFARRAWPDLGRPPLGERLELTVVGRDPVVAEVVALAADLRFDGLTEPAGPLVFRSYARQPWGYFNFAVRAAGPDTEALFAAVRRTIWEVDPARPLFGEMTAASSMASELERPRFGAVLLGGFAAGGLLLAAVGIYGLMAFMVAQRGREIGIRMALGAQRGAVRWMVMRQGMKLVLMGIAIGVPASLAAVRLLEGLLFGIRPGDPVVFGAVLAVLTAAAWLAIYLPAARASRIEPVVALRNE